MGRFYLPFEQLNVAMKKVELSGELEAQVDGMVSEGIFHSFQSAVEELVQLGIDSLRRNRARPMPPSNVPQPERPDIPDPTRDILKM